MLRRRSPVGMVTFTWLTMSIIYFIIMLQSERSSMATQIIWSEHRRWGLSRIQHAEQHHEHKTERMEQNLCHVINLLFQQKQSICWLFQIISYRYVFGYAWKYIPKIIYSTTIMSAVSSEVFIMYCCKKMNTPLGGNLFFFCAQLNVGQSCTALSLVVKS